MIYVILQIENLKHLIAVDYSHPRACEVCSMMCLDNIDQLLVISHNSKGGKDVMTANQIAYWTLQEQKRANLAKEDETTRHNQAQEKQARNELVHSYVDTGAKFIASDLQSRRRLGGDILKSAASVAGLFGLA